MTVYAGKGFGAPKAKHPLDFTGKLKVLLYPDPRLRAENAPITTFDDKLVKLAKVRQQALPKAAIGFELLCNSCALDSSSCVLRRMSTL